MEVTLALCLGGSPPAQFQPHQLWHCCPQLDVRAWGSGLRRLSLSLFLHTPKFHTATHLGSMGGNLKPSEAWKWVWSRFLIPLPCTPGFTPLPLLPSWTARGAIKKPAGTGFDHFPWRGKLPPTQSVKSHVPTATCVWLSKCCMRGNFKASIHWCLNHLPLLERFFSSRDLLQICSATNEHLFKIPKQAPQL